MGINAIAITKEQTRIIFILNFYTMRNVFFFLSFGSLLFSSSCKKSESSTGNCPLNSTTILGAYVYAGETIQQNANSQVVDEYATYPPCEKDDILTFKSDGTYTWTDGVLVCGTRPNGTWSINGTTIITDGNVGIIKSYDCKKLVITTPPGEYPIETMTLVRQ